MPPRPARRRRPRSRSGAADDADRQATIPARIVSSASGTFPRGPAGARREWRACGLGLRRSTAASRPGNGHPEETLTRHQPISIPSGPRRGRECQWPQPGRPRSSRLDPHPPVVRGRGQHPAQQLAVRGLELARARAAPAAPRRPGRRGRRAPAPARRGRGPGAGASGGDPVGSRPAKASAKSPASSRSRRPTWRRNSARARRSSTSTGSPLSSLVSRAGIGRPSVDHGLATANEQH